MPNALNRTATVQARDPELDALARQNGFRSYEEMRLWNQQRQRPTGGTVPGKPARPANDGKPANPNNAMSWHPSAIFDYIRRAMGGQ